MSRVESSRRLGPTNYQARAGDGALLGNTLFVVTFRQEPVHLAAYDPAKRQVTDTWEVPVSAYSDSPGATNLAAYGERYLYTIMHTPAELFRFDRKTETFDRLATLPTTSDRVSGCSGIEIRDGRMFFSTKNDPVLYEIDHDTDDLREIGPPHPDAWKAYALAVGDECLYVGGGSDAYLSAVDPETGERRDILPPRLADEAFVRSTALTQDGRLVVGVSDRLAILDPDEPPSAATVVDVDPDGSSIGINSLYVTEGTMYFTTRDPSYHVWTYEFETEELSAIAAPIDHATGYLAAYDGGLLGLGSGGYSAVWTLDEATGETTWTSLGDVGLSRGAGNVQSLLAADGDVYAGGSMVTGVHNLGSGEFEQFLTAGEPKVMRAANGRIYQAVYPGAGIVEYDPETGDRRELAWIGDRQHRPRALHYHDPTGYLLVGTRPNKGYIGGAITVYDLAADELVSVHRDVVPKQSVTGVASIGQTVFLSTEIYGGAGTDPVTSSARVAAWDPREEAVLWERSPYDDAHTIRGLTVLDGVLYGHASGGRLFGIDPEAREVVVEGSFDDSLERGQEGRAAHYREMATGDLRAHDGRLYGVTAQRAFVFDPGSRDVEVFRENLRGDEAWHNFPQLAIDDAGSLYLAEGKKLLQVELSV